ncbi:hypothetical protein HYV79_02105 [Candidatus Woesearchaeota archaeon]|nr:hypothetical protein [Candidatus Woesearchaeota archaeon]
MKFDIEFITKEIKMLVLSILLVFTLLKLAFSSEDSFVLIKLITSLVIVFFLPYYLISIYWRDELNFAIRAVISLVIGFIVNGILGYYLGLLGLSVNYNYVIIAIIFYMIGGYISYKYLQNE